MTDSLLILASAVRSDPALSTRGARKIVVTERYASETEAAQPHWSPGVVVTAPNLEVAYFTEKAHQDRHFHRFATEIYTVIEGSMQIEINGLIHQLAAGDCAVVLPGAIHLVQPFGTWLCQLVAVNSRGAADKVIV